MGISFEFWNIQTFFSSILFEDRCRINIDDGWLGAWLLIFRLPTLLILAPVIFYVNQNSSKKLIKFPENFNESPLRLNLVEGRTSPNSVENLGHHLTSWNDLTLQVIRGEKKTTRSRVERVAIMARS